MDDDRDTTQLAHDAKLYIPSPINVGHWADKKWAGF